MIRDQQKVDPHPAAHQEDVDDGHIPENSKGFDPPREGVI